MPIHNLYFDKRNVHNKLFINLYVSALKLRWGVMYRRGLFVEDDLYKARALIKAGKHDEARALLATINHPLARKWLGNLNSGQYGKPKREQPLKPYHGSRHFFRALWLVLTLLSCGWMSFGIAATSLVVDGVASAPIPTLRPLSTLQPFPTIEGFDLPDFPVQELQDSTQRLMDSTDELLRGGAVLTVAGLGLPFFLCTGFPPFLFFFVCYWVTGSQIRNERRHVETINTMRGY